MSGEDPSSEKDKKETMIDKKAQLNNDENIRFIIKKLTNEKIGPELESLQLESLN